MNTYKVIIGLQNVGIVKETDIIIQEADHTSIGDLMFPTTTIIFYNKEDEIIGVVNHVISCFKEKENV